MLIYTYIAHSRLVHYVLLQSDYIKHHKKAWEDSIFRDMAKVTRTRSAHKHKLPNALHLYTFRLFTSQLNHIGGGGAI